MDIKNSRVASAIEVLGTPGLGLPDLAIPEMPCLIPQSPQIDLRLLAISMLIMPRNWS